MRECYDQQNYKKRFVDSGHNHDDSFMFMVSCVPIRLVDENALAKQPTILPQNFAGLKIAFQQETEEMVQKKSGDNQTPNMTS
ncbi:hypothetical protein ILUMI_18570 [Ignelater luminosus]|uniref:Uncharacterized protein n=1 Tax=Ignelater luminosus TaxID=2038154 RepID=A0A8K0CHR3_IGNLU|nr:hypothetical protein ILUMI_18570 [Ignelater luminosus]